MTKAQIEKWLLDRNIQNFRFNPDMSVDVAGNVDLSRDFNLTTLPFKFAHIRGFLSVCHTNIATFDNFPEVIGTHLTITESKITSMHNIHKHVKIMGDTLYAHGVTSSVLGVFMIKGVTRLVIDRVNVHMIVDKHMQDDQLDIFTCQQELLDAGLVEYAKL